MRLWLSAAASTVSSTRRGAAAVAALDRPSRYSPRALRPVGERQRTIMSSAGAIGLSGHPTRPARRERAGALAQTGIGEFRRALKRGRGDALPPRRWDGRS